GRLLDRLIGVVLVAGRGDRGRRVGLRDVPAVPVALDAHGAVGVARVLLGRVGRRVGRLVVRRPLARVLGGRAGARGLPEGLRGVVLVPRGRDGRGVVGLRHVAVAAAALDADRRVVVARAGLIRRRVRLGALPVAGLLIGVLDRVGPTGAGRLGG